METILMTECQNWRRERYTEFRHKSNGELLAEVDRKEGMYIVYGGPRGCFHPIVSRSSKPLAIKFAQEYIKGFVPGAEFKYNVMSVKYRLA